MTVIRSEPSESLCAFCEFAKLWIVEPGTRIFYEACNEVISAGARDNDSGICRCMSMNVANQVGKHPLQQGSVTFDLALGTSDVNLSVRVEHLQVRKVVANQFAEIECRSLAELR